MSYQKHILQSKAKDTQIPHLLYVTASRDEEDWPSFMHSHHFTELFYVRSGSGIFQLDDGTVPIGTDDLILVNPHLFHTEVSKEERLSYISLGVEGLSFQFPDQRDFSVLHCGPENSRIRFCFQSMLEEMERQQDHYQEMCEALLRMLSVHLLRLTDSSLDLMISEQTNHDLFRIRRYIDSHYQDNITLDLLSGIAHINKFYLVHSFTQAYGMSPISYLNHRRIQTGKDLLEHTDHSISEIARLTGFSSQCYFAQSFKKSCGMTAREYRKKCRGS